ncbi:MAG: hypothetical protein M1823_004959 [Watsoniomyces obsoletus]|nr:MAG: hypothetical protein M1823_004959 [Watsoniomyces obsoletus]
MVNIDWESGRALGVRFAAVGHNVFFGGRDPTKAPQAAAALAGHDAQAGTIDEAIQYASILVWTARERDPAKVCKDVRGLAGKIIIDLNNRDFQNEVMNDNTNFFDVSTGEKLAANLPDSYIVKAFNTIPMEALDTSADKLRQANAQIFLAGGPPDARRQVEDLAGELGFASMDLGEGKTAMRIADALGDAVRFVMIEGKKGGRANIAINTLPAPDLNSTGGRQSSSYH